ncbi:hypothetical protein [Paenibacillus taichungensis]
MKLEMYRKDELESGVHITFTNGSGRSCTTYLTNPSDSIDHVHMEYLQERLPNVVRREQVEFIKRRYAEEIGRFQQPAPAPAF